MKLTGKSLEQFLEWYLLPKQQKTYKTNGMLGGINYVLARWYSLSSAEQYGVLVDFFDSVGIRIELLWDLDSFKVYVKNKQILSEFNTRPQARTKAIEKANEILNKRL